MKKLIIIIAVVIVGLISVQCKRDDTIVPEDKNPITADSIIGTTWHLVSFKDSLNHIINIPDSISDGFYITFISDSSFTGRSGCNEFGGGYKISNNAILMTSGATTKVYCYYTNEFYYGLNSSFTLNNSKNLISGNGNNYMKISEMKLVKR